MLVLLLKDLRRFPVGNFVSFPAEIIRTSTNVIRRGLNEIVHSKETIGPSYLPRVFEKGKGFVKNDNPLYSIGMKRLFGMGVTTAAVPYATTEIAKSLYNVSRG